MLLPSVSVTLTLPSSEALAKSGGPRRKGLQLLTKLSCSVIFFVCWPVAASHTRTVLSGDAESSFSPSCVQ